MMEITHVLSQGYIMIPEAFRVARHWSVGQELVAIEIGDGILLKPKKPFATTTLDQVAGCLRYQGTPKSLDDFDHAIHQSIMEQWHGCS